MITLPLAQVMVPHMDGLPFSTSAVNCAMPVGHSAGIVERKVLFRRSRRSREVKVCHEVGRVPESWFLLKSITWMAFRALQAAGRLLLKLQTQKEIEFRSG